MRTFLGFTISAPLRQRLCEAQQSLPENEPIKHVQPENMHLTVKFLGDRSRGELDELDRAFQRRLPTPGPMKRTVRGLGAFPDPQNPSVLWAGVDMDEELLNFVKSVENISVNHGADPEDRDFHAHLTLARVKGSVSDPEVVINWIQQFGRTEFGTLVADYLVLFESELTQDGPIYHEMERWPL